MGDETVEAAGPARAWQRRPRASRGSRAEEIGFCPSWACSGSDWWPGSCTFTGSEPLLRPLARPRARFDSPLARPRARFDSPLARPRARFDRVLPSLEPHESPSGFRSRALGLAATALTLLAACGGAQPAPAVSSPLEVSRLYPMRPGSVWTYDVDTGQGLPTLAITRVTSSDGKRSEVSSGADPIVHDPRRRPVSQRLRSLCAQGPHPPGRHLGRRSR